MNTPKKEENVEINELNYNIKKSLVKFVHAIRQQQSTLIK